VLTVALVPSAPFFVVGDSDHTLVLVDGVSINSIDSLNGAVEYGLTSIALNDIEKAISLKNNKSRKQYIVIIVLLST
jgi:outer membrane cobalamin receptor